MATIIDNHAIVNPKAQLGENVSIGPFSIIEHDVTIGDGARIASHALIASGTTIGKECQIHHGAVLGTIPQDLKFHGEITTLEIGDYTVVREYATINRGTRERNKTTVGSHCFLMAYSHIAHDCAIGNHVILANTVNMGGHVHIDDFAVIGGIVAIHQFSHIGCHAMVGGGFRVAKDVPPYVLAGSEPLSFIGCNIVGMKRRNFNQKTIEQIETAYKLIYSSNLNVSQAIEKIKNELPPTEEIKHIIEFIEKSKRGIISRRR